MRDSAVGTAGCAEVSLANQVLIKSIKKAAMVLELFSIERPSLSLAEIGKGLKWNSATTFRICTTLASCRLLERIDNRYRLGISIAQLNRVLVTTMDIRKEGFEFLRYLATEVKHSSYLMVKSGNRMVCIDRVQGIFIVQALSLEIGDSLPLYRGGGPTAVLAYQPLEVQKEILSDLFQQERFSAETEKGWWLRLEKIRQQGYSVSRDEVHKGTAAVGAPIFNTSGDAWASISVGGVSKGFSTKSIPKIANEVVHAARTLSRRLGYDGPR
jgi:DNA-binding IclR family transcriptional regulator